MMPLPAHQLRLAQFVVRQFSLSDFESLVCEMRVVVQADDVCVVLRDAQGTPFQGVLACRFEQVASQAALELGMKGVAATRLRFFHERRAVAGPEFSAPASLHEVTMTRYQGWYWQGRWTPVSAEALCTAQPGTPQSPVR